MAFAPSCVICLILLLFNVQSETFSFSEFILGGWEVQKLESDGKEAANYLYHLEIDEDRGIIGSVRAVEDVENEETLSIEFSENSTTAGAFRRGQDKESLTTLFNFDFKSDSGAVLSYGPWLAEKSSDAYYQFHASPDSFVLTVFGPDLSNMEVFVGSKVQAPEEKTFMQNYGTLIFLSAFFMYTLRGAGGIVPGGGSITTEWSGPGPASTRPPKVETEEEYSTLQETGADHKHDTVQEEQGATEEDTADAMD